MSPMSNCFCCKKETPNLHEMDHYPEKKLCSICYINDREEQIQWNNQETEE